MPGMAIDTCIITTHEVTLPPYKHKAVVFSEVRVSWILKVKILSVLLKSSRCLELNSAESNDESQSKEMTGKSCKNQKKFCQFVVAELVFDLLFKNTYN